MYCPKCDMDFVDGVTICSDCGGELVDKEEYTLKMQAEAEAKAEAEKLEREKAAEKMKAMMAQMAEEGADAAAESELDGTAAFSNRKGALRRMSVEPATYVHQKDKYTDNKSSAVAFFIVGIILCAVAVLAWMDIIKLGLPFNIASSAFAALCLVLAFATNNKANKMKGSIKEEDNLHDDVMSSFLEKHTAEEIDAKINKSDLDVEYNEEEIALERLNVIQDMLTIDHDVPDAAFAAEMAEDLYAKIFEA